MMARRKNFLSAALLLLLGIAALCCAGCTTPGGSRTTTPTSYTVMAAATCGVTLSRLLPQTPEYLSAQARLTVKEGDWEAGGDANILLQAPQRFYFEFSGPMGAAAIIASDGRMLQIWDIRAKKMAISPATEELYILTRLPLSAEDFVRMVMIDPPRDTATSMSGFLYNTGGVQINMADAKGHIHTLEFDAKGRVTAYAISHNNQVAAKLRYFGDGVDAHLPYATGQLTTPSSPYVVYLAWRDGSVTTDIQPPPDAFVLDPPPFVKRMHGTIELNLPTRGN